MGREGGRREEGEVKVEEGWEVKRRRERRNRINRWTASTFRP